MNIFNLKWDSLFCFIIVAFRSGGIINAIPFFGSKAVPRQLKIALSFVFALILTPIISIRISPSIPTNASLIQLAISELLIGLIIGFAAKLIFEGIQLSGQLIGYQIGLAVANVFDPINQTQLALFSQMEFMIALLIFFSLNAHHLFIEALVKSFEILPPLSFSPQKAMVSKIMDMAGNLFLVALQIGAPVIAALLFTNACFGLLARLAPEMNIFIVAMPIGIAIGILVFSGTIPYFYNFLKGSFNILGSDILILLKGMH